MSQDLTPQEVEAKIQRINQIVADFKKEMLEVKQYKLNVIHTVLEQTRHQEIQQLLQDINQHQDQ